MKHTHVIVIFKDYSLVSTSLVIYGCLQILPPPTLTFGLFREGGGHTSRVFLIHVVVHTVPFGAPTGAIRLCTRVLRTRLHIHMGLGLFYELYVFGK